MAAQEMQQSSRKYMKKEKKKKKKKKGSKKRGTARQCLSSLPLFFLFARLFFYSQ